MKFITKADKTAWAAHLAQLHAERRALLSEARCADERRLLKHGFRVYSQADEDGILREIFRRVGESTRTFIELGAADGEENNTLFLLLQGWSGLWVEGSPGKVTAVKKKLAPEIKSGRLSIIQQTITASNIDDLLQRHSPAKEIDLLSIDLDGNDYFVLESIRSVSPRVIVVEYNAKFPPGIRWIMEYNEHHRYDSTDYFGASLRAFVDLLGERGYSLVGCSLLGTNAFFVRKELAKDPPFCSPFTPENHYEPPRYYLQLAFQSGMAPGFGPAHFGVPSRKKS